jgi:Flp pilus assembly protein TadD
VADNALKGGSPEIALQIANNVLAQNPGNGSALATKGEALTALGHPEEAAIAFSQVPPRDPASVSAQIGLGRIRLASDPVAAEAAFLGALSQDPRNGVALNDLGIARDLQGRHTDAQTAYRSALGVDPDMRAAQVNLALSLAMSGQSRDAVQLLRPLASKPDASPQVRHDMAAVLAMSGSRTEAEQILSKDCRRSRCSRRWTRSTRLPPRSRMQLPDYWQQRLPPLRNRLRRRLRRRLWLPRFIRHPWRCRSQQAHPPRQPSRRQCRRPPPLPPYQRRCSRRLRHHPCRHHQVPLVARLRFSLQARPLRETRQRSNGGACSGKCLMRSRDTSRYSPRSTAVVEQSGVSERAVLLMPGRPARSASMSEQTVRVAHFYSDSEMSTAEPWRPSARCGGNLGH